MRNSDRKFSLSNDRAAALELLRLQEAAQLANDRLTTSSGFTRNENLSHVVLAFFNLAQFLTALLDEAFHHLHHAINRKLRESNPKIPDMPEERNPIFFVYPICMGISALLALLLLTTKMFNQLPIVAMLGNGIGGILIMIGGISAMQHAEKHINLNEVSDEELLTHPIFIHNFTMCIVSIYGSILYFIPTWILYDVYKWNKHKPVKSDQSNFSTQQVYPRRCRCHSQRSYSQSPVQTRQNFNSAPNPILETNSPPKKEKNVEEGPIILYCCCVDCCRYLMSPKSEKNFAHEFQVIQVM